MNKLKPNQPHVLHSGDELMLGSLSIMIRFDMGSEVKIIDEGLRVDETRPMTRAQITSALVETSTDEIDVTKPSKSGSVDPGEATHA